MKKIIIVNNNLEIGGVQISLINLLKEINCKYDITLLLFHAKQSQLVSLPEGVKVIVINSPFKHFGMSSNDAKFNPFVYFARAFWVVLARSFGRDFIIKLMLPFQKRYSGYDCAISFLHEGNPKSVYGGCNEFVLRRIDAKQKIGWLHCDFGRCGADVTKSRPIYEKFDKIIACSEGCRQAFIKCYPDFAEKTFSIRNCNNYEQIKSLSENGDVGFDKNYFNIVTVARLSQEKGIERALEAIALCKKNGYNVKYHIVGSGNQLDFLKTKVNELEIGDIVVFYGNKLNPYPYIKAADLFLLSSYHEAAPMVFDEAICLGVPVLATKTTSTYEMIGKNGYGIVCENEQEDLNRTLMNVLGEPQCLARIRSNLGDAQFNNDEIVETLTTILG